MNTWTWEEFCGMDDKDAFKAHNTECKASKKRYAALEAERDEWKRRLDAVIAEAQRWSEDACYCDFNRHGDRTLRCEYCEQTERLIVIAEGRDNEV